MVAFSGANSYSGSPNGNEATKRKVAFPKIAIIASVSLPEGWHREAEGSQCISGEAPGGVQQDRFEKRKV